MLKNYFKIALKVLLRRKFFTFISLFGITFTLVILLVAASFVDHTIGPMAPEKKIDRTLGVFHISLTSKNLGRAVGPLLSYYCLEKYVGSLVTPEMISISSLFNPITMYKDDKKWDSFIKFTDAEFWEILEFEFLEGRPISRTDVDNGNRVAVISEDTRKKYFGAESAVGKTIEADGERYTVVGVVENVPLLRLLVYSEIYAPISTIKANLHEQTLMGNLPGYHAILLAHDRSDFPLIKSEIEQKAANFDFMGSNFEKIDFNPETYVEFLSRVVFLSDDSNIPGMLLIFFLLIVLFMLLPAINLININISRIIERASEIGIRKSFGASSLTLIGQFIVENLILTLIGGLLALLFTAIILGIINQSGIIPHSNFSINHRLFLLGLLVSFIFGFLSGVYPAYKMSRLQPAMALRGGEV